jgi:hypothetical protein
MKLSIIWNCEDWNKNNGGVGKVWKGLKGNLIVNEVRAFIVFTFTYLLLK